MAMSGQLHALVTLPPGKDPLVTLDRRLDGSQSWCGHDGKEKTSLPLLGIKPWLSSLQPGHYTG